MDAIDPRRPYSELLALARTLSAVGDSRAARPLRCALLARTTVTYLAPLLTLFGRTHGLRIEVFVPPFDTAFVQVLDPGSSLYEFAPEVVIVLPTAEDVADEPAMADAAPWTALWTACRERCGAALLQGNVVLPVERPEGLLQDASGRGRHQRLRALNHHLCAAARDGVLVHDTDHLASVLGKERWFDTRFGHFARQPVSFECLPWLCHSLAAGLAAIAGRARRCLVLDLDDTLWGGAVAEVGVEGIELGLTPLGEAFQAFQRYLLALRKCGVLLAVCSRNEPEAALGPFRHHPEMVLREEDVAYFVANHDDKVANLCRLARDLHLGQDALVLVDNDPVERARVREALPEVVVVELPEDPSGFARALDLCRLFEAAAATPEDLERTRALRAEQEREQTRGTFPSLEEFLGGLGLTATVRRLGASDVVRAAQLVNKTNQFNLSTRRCTEPGLRARLEDPHGLSLGLRLRDRFGDYGLVSVLLGTIEGDRLEIDTWLMSCRVLSRGVEDALFGSLVGLCAARGIRSLHGSYVPTARNALVRGHYERLGFEPEGTANDGVSRWRYAISAAEPVRAPWIEICLERDEDHVGTVPA